MWNDPKPAISPKQSKTTHSHIITTQNDQEFLKLNISSELFQQVLSNLLNSSFIVQLVVIIKRPFAVVLSDKGIVCPSEQTDYSLSQIKCYLQILLKNNNKRVLKGTLGQGKSQKHLI